MNASLGSKIQQKLCLATLSDKEYWPGTHAMIKSFLQHNQWFNGDILIITDDKKLERKKLQLPITKFIKPSNRLSNTIEDLCTKSPHLKFIKKRLYLFEIFNLKNYDKVIYIDSDIIFTQAVAPNILFSSEISAVKDPWHFRGFSREKMSCNKIPDSEKDVCLCYKHFFNSGFISIDKELIKDSTYNQIIETIKPEFYSNITDSIIDEPILNSIFEYNINPLPLSFNCPIHLITENRVNDSIAAFHFTGIYKPWKIKSWFVLVRRNRSYFRLLISWLKAYL